MEQFCLMKILITAATRLEILPLMSRLSPENRDEAVMTHTTIGEHSLDILVTGIGMTHAAYHTGRALALKKYDLAINAGIAGAYQPETESGTVVHVTSECLPEIGVLEGDRILTFYEMGFMDKNQFPFRDGRLFNDQSPAIKTLQALPEMSANTVNQIRTSPEWLAMLMRDYPAQVESMEGAAFFYGCLTERTPCIQLRSVSNQVSERDRSKWKIALAVENLNNVVIQILHELCI